MDGIKYVHFQEYRGRIKYSSNGICVSLSSVTRLALSSSGGREREREREEQHMMFFLFNIAGKESHWFECPKTMGLALDAHVRVPTPKC
jgi:hypothetical protein